MIKYQIWNRTDNIITPVGEIFTPAQWIERYPAAAQIPFVIAAGEVNGGFCTALAQMVSVYEGAGCDFSTCTGDEDKLAKIEAFESVQATAAQEAQAADAAAREAAAGTDVRLADALEDLVVLQMSDITV